VDAKIQHLPEDRWFVTGEPSVGIMVLKFWVSLMTAGRVVRTDPRELEDRAERARRFLKLLAN
jgi:hypothetical protein